MSCRRSLRRLPLSTVLGAAFVALLAAGCAPEDTTAPPPAAVAPPDGEALAALDARVIDLAAQLARRHSPEIRDALASTIAARAPVFTRTVSADPAAAVAGALPEELLTRLRAELPEAASLLEVRVDRRGPVEHFIPQDPSGRDMAAMILLHDDAGGPSVSLHLATEPADLFPGAVLHVRGVLAPGGADLAAETASIEPSPRAVAGGTCTKTGNQKVAVLLVAPPGVTPPISAAEVRDQFFDQAGRSLDGYWREASYGATSASGDTFGWYTLDREYNCMDLPNLWNAAIAAADADVYFPDYDRVAIVLPTPSTGCGYAGTSNLGCSARTSPGDGAFVASASYLIADYLTFSREGSVGLISHELGHTLGLGHASSRDYGGEAEGCPGATGTLSEYGDPFDVMGNGTNLKVGHYDAPHKAYLGWLDATQITTVETAGTYTLSPYETLAEGAGARALKVRRGPGLDDWLWLEHRQPVGAYDLFSPAVFTGALVHQQDATTLYQKTHLLDLTPGSASGITDFNDGALQPGTSYFDPYTGLSLSVSPSGSDLLVDVAYGAPTCTAQPAVVNVAPAAVVSAPGAVQAYTIKVTNKDTGTCPTPTFTVSAVGSTGLTTSVPTTSVAVAPGQTASVPLNVTISAAQAPGLYAVRAIAGRNGSISGYGVAAVPSASPGFTVTLSTPQASYPVGSQFVVTGLARLPNNTPAGGTAFSYDIIRPDGGLNVASITSTGAGAVGVSVGVSQKGTYTFIANGTYNGKVASSAPIQVTVF